MPFAVEVPDSGGDFFQQIVIVRDQEQRSLVLLQRDIQRVDGFQIEVVGRLVEHQHVRFLQHQLAEDQPRGLAARQRFGRLHSLVAHEQHLAEQAAQFFGARRGIDTAAASRERSDRAESSRGDPARRNPTATSWPHSTEPLSIANGSSTAPGALAIRDRSSVVLPTPLRPSRPIFSPRETLAVKSLMTDLSP